MKNKKKQFSSDILEVGKSFNNKKIVKKYLNMWYTYRDSKMLEHQLRDFHAYVLRVRRKTLSSADRSMASNEEHEKIMMAIKAHNADEAEKLAHMHMINAYENMVKSGLHEAYAKNSNEEKVKS